MGKSSNKESSKDPTIPKKLLTPRDQRIANATYRKHLRVSKGVFGRWRAHQERFGLPSTKTHFRNIVKRAREFNREITLSQAVFG